MKQINVQMILLALATLVGQAVSAHGLYSEPRGPDKVRFFFDDGEPLVHGFVTVYDARGREIGKGDTDAEGVFDYSGFKNVDKIVVADVHGHRHEHPVAGAPAAPGPVGLRLVVVVLLLLLLAAVFYVRKTNRNRDETRETVSK